MYCRQDKHPKERVIEGTCVTSLRYLDSCLTPPGHERALNAILTLFSESYKRIFNDKSLFPWDMDVEFTVPGYIWYLSCVLTTPVDKLGRQSGLSSQRACGIYTQQRAMTDSDPPHPETRYPMYG
ncbi:hypothetical protein STEG23_020947 [Scotinomys teguina]